MSETTKPVSDLVERLRKADISEWYSREREAADRIEELEGIVQELLSYVESDYIGSRGKDYSSGAIAKARAAMGE